MLVNYFFMSENCLRMKKKLSHRPPYQNIRIFWYCRICQKRLMFLHGDEHEEIGPREGRIQILLCRSVTSDGHYFNDNLCNSIYYRGQDGEKRGNKGGWVPEGGGRGGHLRHWWLLQFAQYKTRLGCHWTSQAPDLQHTGQTLREKTKTLETRWL